MVAWLRSFIPVHPLARSEFGRCLVARRAVVGNADVAVPTISYSELQLAALYVLSMLIFFGCGFGFVGGGSLYALADRFTDFDTKWDL